MKNKLIYIALAAVLIVCTVTGCTAQTANKETGTVTDSVSEKSETVTDSDSTSAVSAEGISKEDNQKPNAKNESERKEETTTAKNSASVNAKNPQKPTQNNRASTGSTTKRTSESAKQTTTKRQTTTQKQTTTKKPTTTRKPTTTKKSGLSKSDVEWVQSQANAYIRSKGITVNSGVGSFSGKISTKNFTSKSDLLSYVKSDIDYEYEECLASGWNKVEMYVKIESRTDGSYYIYIMYG